MSFWDTSALVPLLVNGPNSAPMRARASRAGRISVWWGTKVECGSALARLEREGEPVEVGFAHLRTLARAWDVVLPSVEIEDTAIRMLRSYPLRAADALQLAAAYATCSGRCGEMELFTLDDRLAAAAAKEGFTLPCSSGTS